MVASISLIVLGFILLIFGANWLVDGASTLAKRYKIPDLAIGLTIVAFGTSLPELVTSVVAATKKNSDIAIGNVIGSNIFNILLVLAISSLVNPIEYDPKFNTDLYILIGGTLFLLLAMLTGQRKKLDRWEAGVLFGAYLGYTIYLVIKEL
jgi:cation:H+ antiporter